MFQPFTADLGLQEATLILLSETEALKRGHFVLTRGNHAAEYVDVRELYAHPEKCWALCRLIAQCIHPSVAIDVVIGPARGGNDLSGGVAYWLSQFRFPKEKRDPSDSPIRRAWTDKIGTDDFAIAACHEKFVRGKRVLLVDDVSTTGASLEKAARCIQNAGGEIVLAVAVWNRGATLPETLKTPLASLLDRKIPSWAPDACPLCKTSVPVNTDVGHGKEFLAREARKTFGGQPYAIP